MKRLLLILTLALLASSAGAQTLARQGWAGSGIQVQPWYRQAIFYEIDPISFADASGDGFGDLRGITAHLDYVESLHVDAILLSPLVLEPAFAQSGTGPAFEPLYGSLDDLDDLIAAASSHHLRVLVDLNLDQARTAAEAGTTARFWLARGIAGLHVLCASGMLSAAEFTARLNEVRRVVAAAPGQRVLLLEQPAPAAPATTPHSHHHTTSASQPIPQAAELLLSRDAAMPPALNAAALTAALERAHLPGPGALLPAQPFPAFRSDAPDRARSFDRYPVSSQAALARTLAMILLTTPAVPVLYFGQELGMATTPMRPGVPPAPLPRPAEPGDAGEPTPMQWDARTGAPNGFTAGTPWIALNPATAMANVDAEDAAPDSLLNWYRLLDRLRHSQASLRDGAYVLLKTKTPDIVGWVRLGAKIGGVSSAPVVELVNLSANSSVVSLTDALRQPGLSALTSLRTHSMKTLARSTQAAPGDPAEAVPLDHIVLPPFGCYAGELTTQRGLESVATPVKRSRRSGR